MRKIVRRTDVEIDNWFEQGLIQAPPLIGLSWVSQKGNYKHREKGSIQSRAWRVVMSQQLQLRLQFPPKVQLQLHFQHLCSSLSFCSARS
jgi:hypothetical protein